MAESSPPAQAAAGAGSPGRPPLAWLEIESLTFGDFVQVVRVPFYHGQAIRIGRDARTWSVSATHCEVYSVLFDKDEPCPALVYVRDCQSTSGTRVNGQPVVQEQPWQSPARLLGNSDAIAVGPCSIRLCDYAPRSSAWALSALQRKEAALFADRFVVTDTVLGAGGFATVYLALDVKTGRQVSCKVHDLSRLGGGGGGGGGGFVLDRIDQEMLIWSQLDHPNIVLFHHAYKTDSTMFTIGDLATGGDLFSFLEREQSIPELEIKWVATQVLRAVDYLHCRGVAHRDIKPENVLCYATAHPWRRIVLADFGSAELTSVGGQRAVASDVWSIGALVLQLLAGTESVNLTEGALCGDEIAHLVAAANLCRAGPSHWPISQNGERFISACLSPDPLARPSAAEAAKHPWLRESAEQALLFREREKHLAWRPRGLIMPAVVRLPDVCPTPAQCRGNALPAQQPTEEAARHGALGATKSQPRSNQRSSTFC